MSRTIRLDRTKSLYNIGEIEHFLIETIWASNPELSDQRGESLRKASHMEASKAKPEGL